MSPGSEGPRWFADPCYLYESDPRPWKAQEPGQVLSLLLASCWKESNVTPEAHVLAQGSGFTWSEEEK